ncbi:hypothetical protein SJY89_06510 [Bacillus velezensis]|nr:MULTISPECIES: hypothetical protein [Bacillus amyloliquefaciens group]MCZ4248006.1 hypothetical protein [Bacillus amyloliquefaciens]MDX7894873.1 hypothetical protein [Bacillus velezensis]MDX8026294.1 hypothetical protein [Bacillus velezensis]MDX8199102.1 hypothetical protein [Bacillus velezensis]MDX8224872.1 hypothetical protein [Bacillus velezensis]
MTVKQDYKPFLQQAIEVFEQKYGDNGRNYLMFLLQDNLNDTVGGRK